MAAFKLPRLKANLAIVNGQGKPLDYFLRFWNIEVAPRIEQQEADQNAILAQIQELQASQAQQLILINEALELAGIAISLTGGNSGSTTVEVDMLSGVWVNGPQVDLTGVVAGDLTIPGSGLFSKSGTTSFFGDSNGLIRLVEIVAGVDTVIGGPWGFVITRTDPNPSGTVYVANASQIPTFTSARSTTGAVSYRIDTQMVDSDVTNIDVKLYARRTT